jgi:hypothetical protein
MEDRDIVYILYKNLHVVASIGQDPGGPGWIQIFDAGGRSKTGYSGLHAWRRYSQTFICMRKVHVVTDRRRLGKCCFN